MKRLCLASNNRKKVNELQTLLAPLGIEIVPQEALGVAEASDLFTVREEHLLLSLARSGAVSAEDLRAKLQIVVEERRNYDPLTTRVALLHCAGARSLVIDTTQHHAKQVSKLVVQQAQQWWPQS